MKDDVLARALAQDVGLDVGRLGISRSTRTRLPKAVHVRSTTHEHYEEEMQRVGITYKCGCTKTVVVPARADAEEVREAHADMYCEKHAAEVYAAERAAKYAKLSDSAKALFEAAEEY